MKFFSKNKDAKALLRALYHDGWEITRKKNGYRLVYNGYSVMMHCTTSDYRAYMNLIMDIKRGTGLCYA